jgi:hypothetical protein
MNKRINGINGHKHKIKVEDKLDESQLSRLAAGVPVDSAREMGVCINPNCMHENQSHAHFSHQSRLRKLL